MSKKKKEHNIHVINEKFGKKLREIRLSKGLSQEELGLQSGLHRTYIGQIERAEKNITLQNIYRLANTLDMEVKELFDFQETYINSTKNKKTSSKNNKKT